MAKFVKAVEGPKHTVIYTDEKGRRFIYSGGDPNWRNNNPGNLRPGAVTKRNGAIGKAGGFAIFPDKDIGHTALLDCLQTTYANSDLAHMIKGFSPPGENDTKRYLKFLKSRTGVRDNRKIKDFSPTEFKKLWNAIEDMEGKGVGTIMELSNKGQITRVRKDKKGTIVSYFIKNLGWVSKAEGIQLARSGKVDAVEARSGSGSLYLRARPDARVTNNLDNLG